MEVKRNSHTHDAHKAALPGSYPEVITCEGLVASGTHGEDFDLCYIFWHGKTSFTKVWPKSKFAAGFTSKGRRCGRIRAAVSPGRALQNHHKGLSQVRTTLVGCFRK